MALNNAALDQAHTKAVDAIERIRYGDAGPEDRLKAIEGALNILADAVFALVNDGFDVHRELHGELGIARAPE